ncbi:MAG: radical SAM protein [Candidatus Bipolaricaulota bacterium]
MYIHIPFCQEICDFCPYNKVAYKPGLAGEYSKALRREVELYESNLPSGLNLSSVYIGGGSPSLLPEGLRRLLDLLRDKFGLSNDIGLELHPRDADRRTLTKLKDMGVTMVSLGIQSFNQDLLRGVGRAGARFSNEKVARRVIDAGFKCVDIDLMFSASRPETSLKDFTKSINLGADQVSTYPLIPFSYTKWGKKYLSKRNFLFNQFKERNFLNRFANKAREKGYRRSSIWSFTKRSARQYSSVTRRAFLGIGAGATSIVGRQFLVNTFSVREYIKATRKRLPVALEGKLSKREKEIWYLFWQLYNTQIYPDKFKKIFDRGVEEDFSHILRLGRWLNLIDEEKGKIFLTEKGANLFHVVELLYTKSYLETVWERCLRDPWPDRIELS